MRTALLLTLLVLAGCGSQRRLQNMSAGTTGCRPQAIEISNSRGGASARAWTARCNGAVYQCTHTVHGAALCTRAAHPMGTSSSSLAERRRQEELLQRVGPNFEFARAGDVLRGVRATFDAGSTQLTFFFAPEVSRTEVQVAITSTNGRNPAACPELVFAGTGRRLQAGLTDSRGSLPRAQLIEITQAREAPTVTFCGREWALRRADVTGFARFAEYIDEALADAPPSVTTPAVASSDEAAVRARLDARRDALRACSGAPGAVAIEAAWDAGGPLRVHVRGQDDAAVNACVQSALGTPSVAPSSAGRLIHVLEPAAINNTPSPTTDLRCRPNQVAVPAGGHCQECGPLDGCASSPATCRPACARQADCAEGNCDARVGACVRLCG